MRRTVPEDVVGTGSFDADECLVEDGGLMGSIVVVVVVVVVVGVVNRSVRVGEMGGSLFDGTRAIVVVVVIVHMMIA
jgi:hypothetical protein